jgi:hypothetical protein
LKKEITIAACSAVALIFLLGSVSYLLFPKVSVQGYTASIDAYTQLGGKGSNVPGGNFSISKRDNVTIYAEVRNASNIPQEGRLVTYEVHWPASGPQNGSIYAIGTNETSASGIAEIIRIPIWAPEFNFTQFPNRDPRGTWLVYVTTSINGQPLSDTLTFFVRQ